MGKSTEISLRGQDILQSTSIRDRQQSSMSLEKGNSLQMGAGGGVGVKSSFVLFVQSRRR